MTRPVTPFTEGYRERAEAKRARRREVRRSTVGDRAGYVFRSSHERLGRMLDAISWPGGPALVKARTPWKVAR